MYQPTNRTRTRSTFVPLQNVQELVYCNGQTSLNSNIRPDQGYNFIGNGEDETTTDNDGVGFYALSRSGGIVVNPFTSVKRKFTASNTSGSWSKKSGTGCSSCTGYIVAQGTYLGDTGVSRSHYNPPTPWPSNDSLIVDAGTKAKAGVVEPTLASLVTLAEMRETISFITRPWASFERLATRARRRDRIDLADILDTTAGTWLAYRYALGPLLGEIQSAVELFNKKYSNRVERYTSRGKAVAVRTPQVFSSYTAAPSGGGFDRTTNQQWTREVSVMAGVLYEHRLSLGTDAGFTVQEVPSAIWEAITLSFVADWVVNVGNYLRAITPKFGVRELATWTTVKTTDSFTWSSVRSPKNVTGCGAPYYSTHTFAGNPSHQASITTESLVRTPGVEVGLAVLTEQFDLNLVRDQKRLLDAIALVWTIGGFAKHVRKGGRLATRKFREFDRWSARQSWHDRQATS